MAAHLEQTEHDVEHYLGPAELRAI
jgi:hypothetical protein